MNGSPIYIEGCVYRQVDSLEANRVQYRAPLEVIPSYCLFPHCDISYNMANKHNCLLKTAAEGPRHRLASRRISAKYVPLGKKIRRRYSLKKVVLIRDRGIGVSVDIVVVSDPGALFTSQLFQVFT